MRRLTTLLSIGALCLAACVGDIGDGSDEPNGPASKPTSFECDPTVAGLTATAIHRLPKSYFQASLAELLSTLDDGMRDALMASLATRLDLIPTDNDEHYSTNDDAVTQDHVDAVFGVSVTLAAKVADDAEPYASGLLTPCGDGLDRSALEDDACLTTFIAHYGRKAFRRPLSSTEVDDFKTFYHTAVATGVDGMGMLMGRFVAHPSFYYRFDSEGEEVDGVEGDDAVYALTKWELLSKVTFLFWGAPPTDALYDRVDATDLSDDAALGTLVDDVLADPKSEQGVLRFYREWLKLDDTKMPATEGNVVAGQAIVAAAGIDALPPTHRDDMIQEVLDLTKHYTLTTNGTLEDIFTSRTSFAKTPALASIYGVEPWDGSPDHLVTLPKAERSGLLTRAAFVASGAEYTRPIIKGKLVRTRILCEDISPPPPGLKIEPLTHPADKTTRQAVDEATAADTCQGCHHQMNPLGYLTESYDPLGRFRKSELRFADGTADIVAELPIETQAVAGINEDDTAPLADGVALGEALADSSEAPSCMALNYFEFVTGRDPDTEKDGCDLAQLRDQLTESDGSLKGMLKASVMQQSFRRRMVK